MPQTPEYRRLVRLAAGYNRRAANLGLRGRITADELLYLLPMPCHYCGVVLEPSHGSFDHVLPMERGGTNSLANMVRCCTSCQRRKFTKTPTEYMQHQALLVECAVCGRSFQPRWAEYQRGVGRVCSRRCAGKRRWQLSTSARSTPAPGAPDGKPTTGTPQ